MDVLEEKDSVRQGSVEEKCGLSKESVDTLGEILNISMGAAATAMSSVLNRQVMITPPVILQKKMESSDYGDMEPAVLVQIRYVEGLTGNNIMLFRQNDMQLILSLLMGSADSGTENTEFDELSRSAACELMNQMMGSSATVLSEILEMPINISTPDTFPVTGDSLPGLVGADSGTPVISVSFGLEIKEVITTSFISILPLDFAGMIIDRVTSLQKKALEAIQPSACDTPLPQTVKESDGVDAKHSPVTVKKAKFPDFSPVKTPISASNASMDLLMNVPLNVTVEIGKCRKKIREIMEFGPGTVIELEKQAGAPVDIVVNGQLIARGDVVVIEDNFGVRITEILGTEHLTGSLGQEEQNRLLAD